MVIITAMATKIKEVLDFTRIVRIVYPKYSIILSLPVFSLNLPLSNHEA